MSGRNDTEGDNHVIGLERATVSLEINEFSNVEMGFKRQSEGSNGGGSAPHALVKLAGPLQERKLVGGASFLASSRVEGIASNLGRTDWLLQKRLLEDGALEGGNDVLEVRFGSEHDSRSIILLPASVSEKGEFCGDFSKKGGTIFESENFPENNNGRSLLVDCVENPHRFAEDLTRVEILDSTHNIFQEDVSPEDDLMKGNLAAGLNLNKPSGNFCGETMHRQAETGIAKKTQYVKSEAETGIGKKTLYVKSEVEHDREHMCSDQDQELGLPEQNNGFQLTDPEIDREVGENSQSLQVGRAVLESSTVMLKNANQHFLSTKENNFYEYDTDEDNVSLNSQVFQHGDMVWGKVKSHPWWPGHVFNEAFATASVKRTRREGHILVAFFGDSSYGWFDPSELIPFEPNFADKSKQTSSRNFLKAVEEAVDEASRRRAVGIACCCRNPRTFRPAAVEGYFAVDVVDYEPGGVYCEQQVKAARDSFQPVQFLSFVKQMALMPRSSEQQTIEGLQSVATILAYRRAVFVEFDETYPQAFGVDPVRPPQPAGTYNERVPRAPLSGPLVIAEALSERSGSSKLGKPKNSKKDNYLFKKRDDSNDQKPSVKEIASKISDKEIQNSHSSEVQNFVFQPRIPSPKEKQRTVQKKELQGPCASVENANASVEQFHFHTVQASVGSMATNVSDKKLPGVKKSVSVGTSHKQKAEKLSNPGGQKVPKAKNLNKEKKLALVKQHHDPFSSATVGLLPVDAPDRKSAVEDQQGLASSVVNRANENRADFQNVMTTQRLVEATPTPTTHSLDKSEKTDAESVSASRDAYRHEGQPIVSGMMEAGEVASPESKTSQVGTTQKKAKSLKRSPIQSLDNSDPDAACTNGVQGEIKKMKKKKKVATSTVGDQIHMPILGDVCRDTVPEIAAHINSVSKEDLQREHTQRRDQIVVGDSPPVKAMKPGSGSTENFNLRQLVSDLLILALDPFHGIERNGPENALRAFLGFRSLVYQKSLVLPSAGDAVVQQGVTSSETPDHKSLVCRTANDSDDEPPVVWRKTQATKAKETMKSGTKRSLSENSHDVSRKRLKKQPDAKVAFTDGKLNQKPSEVPQMERKELSSTTVNRKLDPGRKLTTAPEAPEPTLINIKFPIGTSPPSESQLKARFARFGPLDLSGTRIFYRSGTCRVVFKFKSDATAAYNATHNKLFGHGVRYTLKEVDPVGKVPEQDSAKRRHDDGWVSGQAAAPFRSRGERPGDPKSCLPLLPRKAPAVATTMQLKSCLKKPAPDDASGNGVSKDGGPRVKFMLSVEDNSGDGAPSVIAMDVNINSKMVQLPLPTPLPPPPLPFPREIPRSLLSQQRNQIVEEKAAAIDISHQLLSLLLKCNDIVSNVKCTLGYVPYHPL